MKARILFPDKKEQDIILHQTAPGLYSGELTMNLPGDYFVSVSGYFPEKNQEKITVGPHFFGLSIPYSPEYADFSEDHTLLKASAIITGGKMLYPGNKDSEAWLFKKSSTKEYIPIWELLVYIGLILFLCEIAVRKISLSKKNYPVYY